MIENKDLDEIKAWIDIKYLDEVKAWVDIKSIRCVICLELISRYPNDATINHEAFRSPTVIYNGNSLCKRHFKFIKYRDQTLDGQKLDVLNFSDTEARDAIRYLG